jgi:hypothetical protein
MFGTLISSCLFFISIFDVCFFVGIFDDLSSPLLRPFLNSLAPSQLEDLNWNMNRFSWYHIDRIFVQEMCTMFQQKKIDIHGWIGKHRATQKQQITLVYMYIHIGSNCLFSCLLL